MDKRRHVGLTVQIAEIFTTFKSLVFIYNYEKLIAKKAIKPNLVEGQLMVLRKVIFAEYYKN